MSQIYEVNAPQLYVGHKPVRDPKYRAFIRTLPCVGCGRKWGIEASHTGAHGLSTKSDDTDCIPLCRKRCHREFDADPHAFVKKKHLDIPALIRMFQAFYKGTRLAEPRRKR